MNGPRIQVLKRSGEYEPFSEAKVRSSLRRAGAEEELIDAIVRRVERELYDGISTREIYAHVFALLRQMRSPVFPRYNLKSAIMELGPSGFPFERFVAGVLKEEGFTAVVGHVLQGKCVDHEVDIVAQKAKKHYMIEAKFHNLPGTKSDIKDALYTFARFMDLERASVEIGGHRAHLDQAWLVTNTKVTSQVRQYARCVGMRVTSWNYPARSSLRRLIEKSGLHPVTSLESLSQQDKTRLLEDGIVFCRDFLHRDVSFLSPEQLHKAREEARHVCRDRF
jgi:Holliday junction resolvase